jgi:hypothetical protein
MGRPLPLHEVRPVKYLLHFVKFREKWASANGILLNAGVLSLPLVLRIEHFWVRGLG